MGTEFYIVDRQAGEAFLLGKNLGLYNLSQNLDLYLSDELAFKATTLMDMGDSNPSWSIGSCLELTERIWRFCHGRSNLSIVGDHFFEGGYIEYNRCCLVESRYDKEDLEWQCREWAASFDNRKAKTDEKTFLELAEYYRIIMI